jgi:H+/Cl- antiporter ClcA/CBS domain-containing protein
MDQRSTSVNSDKRTVFDPAKIAENNPRHGRLSINVGRPTEAFRTSHKLSMVGEDIDKMGTDETSSNRYDVLIMLFCVGIATGVLNGFVHWSNRMISIAQSDLIEVSNLGPLYFVITTTCFCTISAFIIYKGKIPAPVGSGIPEVKSLMVNDCAPSDYPRTVSLKILLLRVFSLVFASGSGISIGIQGPLVHSAVCISYCFANYVPNFQPFLENPAIMKQIFAASAAAGLATVFNAPVGGLLFSVEVTSTYYLISNYWRSFMASTTGAVIYTIFLINRNKSAYNLEVDYVKHPYNQWELPFFALLGMIAGGVCYVFALLHQRWILVARSTLRRYPVSTAALAGALSAVLVYAIHAYSNNGVTVTVLVHDAFKDCAISTMSEVGHTSRIGGLFAALFVRMVMTIVGTTLQISCGLFMPMMAIGSIIGRIFGQIVFDWSAPGQNIYVAGYAMVGAAAFVSGTTHTISAAVIVIEMTGQIGMLLPCLIGAVIACGVNKSLKLSLYDQGMVNKGLESFELLLLTGDGFTQVMDEHALSVSHTCQVADLFIMLENGTQEIFPVVDTPESGKLVGSIARRDVFLFIKRMFDKKVLGSYIRATLPYDTKVDDALLQKRFLKVADNKTTQARFRLISEAGKRMNSMGLSGLREMREMVTGKPTSPRSENSTDGDIEKGTELRALPSPSDSPALSRSTTSNSESSESGKGIQNNTPTFRSVSTASDASSTSNASSVNPLTQSPATIYEKIVGAGLSPANAQVIEDLLALEVDLAKEPKLPVNIFPFTILEHTTMDQLYVLFEMVKVQCVFVLKDDGKLRGMINKDLLLQNLRNKVK